MRGGSGLLRLSAFLITKNEAQDLPGCLESLAGWVDEIVVVDDQSSDDTLAIAKSFGAITFSRALDGFGTQKQFALEQTTGEWLFSIDADERVSKELSAEIREMVQAPQKEGYEIQRHFYFLGQRMRFGGVGTDWTLRLFKRSAGHFLPVRVHERVEVKGAVGRLVHPLQHYSYATLQEYIEKSNLYTSLAAEELWQSGRKFSWLDVLRPFWELFVRIGLKSAWLDGPRGLFFAGLSAHTAWLRSLKLWEIENRQNDSTDDTNCHPE